ncbi:hypothetical protein NTE_00857 [Candidatus Nitrososphaera evergladensis SR1]|uniref:Uncharacterized protein n=1 Tax=Candidatus Nitrososphaera evergladensis SR1 TaxID=1459636 RepID=A0A075MNZ0_9ARCH|nr:hypothetical protein [Candidatus Nitrososphaera evergladensis]AIF82933.1 hypothetical protein NTE_00857 [Candidatus Nitrososphaera evergladensis SR1]
MSNNQKNTGSIPGKDLGRAMNNLRKSLGPTVVDLLITDLQRQGITLAGGESYSIKQVEGALKKTFGQDGGELLTDMISKSLQEP